MNVQTLLQKLKKTVLSTEKNVYISEINMLCNQKKLNRALKFAPP
jgi:hypothetical protein